ncbi:MAG: hypothetical protein ABI091_07290 [Ferruginibacter sp.]
MSNVVVSFADGSANYAKALMRLELSLKQVEFDGRFKGINDYGHIGSPFHKGHPESVPYAFKAYSIKKAIEEGGRYFLWCDSPVYATKSIQPIFDHIKEHGYLFFDNVGFSIGDYTSDNCINKFGMTRQEAFDSKMLMACVMGFDIENIKAKEFLDKYINAASDGISYIGDWSNENLQVSNDMRVKGHRHDQSVASILVKQMGLDVTIGQQTYFAYAAHKGLIPIADSVCLWSEGI